MNPKEKIDYVKNLIAEKAKISPSGRFCIYLYTVTEGESEFDAELISRNDQWSVLKKLEEEGSIKNLRLDEKNNRKAWLEVPKAKTRRSNILSYIKTTDQLLQCRYLFDQMIGIVDFSLGINEIKPDGYYRTSTKESNDDLIQLLIDLGIVDFDWDKLQEQTHRQIGYRRIEFGFKGEKVLKLYARITGKNGRIRKEALELISKEIGNRFSFNKIVCLFGDIGVPESMFVPITKWKAVFYVLSFYSTSNTEDDYQFLLKILSGILHPLMFAGDEELAQSTSNQYRSWLKYDGLVVENFVVKKIDEKQNYESEQKAINTSAYSEGITTPYESTDLELFILKKILLEHKARDDRGFIAKEFSFNNDSFEAICRVINRLIEDNILQLSANSRPEADVSKEIGGIDTEDGSINWSTVQKINDHSEVMDSENGCVIFDTDVTDEVRLKGRLDIAIEEFMNDRAMDQFGRLSPSPSNQLSYQEQRSEILNEMLKGSTEAITFQFSGYHDQRLSALKTILSLEKENLLRIRELDGIEMHNNRGEFIGKWSKKDAPFAKIQLLKDHRRQVPLPITIVGDIGIKGFEQKVILQKPKNKRIQIREYPDDTEWEDIIIQFLNDHEVILSVKDQRKQTTFEEMGFQNGKNKLPNVQWDLLLNLARSGGSISWKDGAATDKGKKRKQNLADGLKAYFQIDSDPFYEYRKEKQYRIKLNLIPEATPDLGDEDDTEDKLGTKSFYSEQTPQVYESNW